MTESKPVPDYVELKSKEQSPTTLEPSVELRVSAKSHRTSYVLYNWLASLEFIISIVSLIFYLVFHFSGLLITLSALGIVAVGAGCFFSYLAISRIDPKKQTYAFIAFCLAAGLCFLTSIISLDLVFRNYKPAPNLAFSSTEPVSQPAVMPAPMPVTMPKRGVHPTASKPASAQNIEPAYIDPSYQTDGGKTDSSNPDSPVSSSDDIPQNSASISADPSIAYVNQAFRKRYVPYDPNGYTSYSSPAYYPYNNGNSYSSSSSYSNSYTYWYSDPYPYSISYSYSYTSSSSPYGSNYYVDTRTSYDNYSPYGQPSYSNQYSYSGWINGNENGYVTYDPPHPTPLDPRLYGEPKEIYNSSSKEEPIAAADPTNIEMLTSEPDGIPYDEPTYNAEDSNTNSTSLSTPINVTNDSSTSANIAQNLSDPTLVDPIDASTSQVYHPRYIAPGEPIGAGSSGNTGYAGYMPVDPVYPSPPYNGYSSYSSSSSFSNSYTYSYSDYSISSSYTYSTSDSTYGSSYSIFSSSNYDNYRPYGQPSYSSQYSYSYSSNNGGNSYTYTYHPYLRPSYAYTAYEPYYYNYNAYGSEEPQTPSSYAYTTYEPYYPNYNTYGVEEAQTQPSYSSPDPYQITVHPTYAEIYGPPTRFYKTNTAETSSVSSVAIALSVFLFVIKILLFVALITQAHELKKVLKQQKQVVLEESTIKSESQIV